MELRKEAFTQVHANPDGEIVIFQPEEECHSCGNSGNKFVFFSADRARKIAAELLRIADEVDGAK